MHIKSMKLQQGIAIVLVMWLVAGLTFLVVGASAWIRNDNQLVRLHVAQAQQHFTAKGIVYLVMRDIEAASRAGVYFGREAFETEFQLGDDLFQIEARPVTGLINLNRAPEELLLLLFTHALNVSDSDALTMTHRLMDWRDPEGSKRLFGASADDYSAAGLSYGPRGAAFLAKEDLMQVLGMSVSDFDVLKDLISVIPTQSYGVNPVSAPPEVLSILARGDESLVETLISIRADLSQDVTSLMLELLPSSLISSTTSRDYRVDVAVKNIRGQEKTYRFWVVYNPKLTQAHGVPWKVLH